MPRAVRHARYVVANPTRHSKGDALLALAGVLEVYPLGRGRPACTCGRPEVALVAKHADTCWRRLWLESLAGGPL